MKYKLIVYYFTVLSTLSFSQTALHFDGNNDYVNLNSISNVMDTLNEFTIDFWVQFDVDNNADYGAFFASNTSNNGNVFLQKLLLKTQAVESNFNDAVIPVSIFVVNAYNTGISATLENQEEMTRILQLLLKNMTAVHETVVEE